MYYQNQIEKLEQGEKTELFVDYEPLGNVVVMGVVIYIGVDISYCIWSFLWKKQQERRKELGRNVCNLLNNSSWLVKSGWWWCTWTEKIDLTFVGLGGGVQDKTYQIWNLQEKSLRQCDLVKQVSKQLVKGQDSKYRNNGWDDKNKLTDKPKW